MKEIDNIDKIRKTRNEVRSYIPNSKKSGYDKVLEITKGGRIVKAQCASCISYDTISKSVRTCMGFSCPLYFVRSYKYEDTDLVREMLRKEMMDEI